MLILGFSSSLVGQISGRILIESDSCPGAEIKLKGSKDFVTSDFDGIFLLPHNEDRVINNLLISFSKLTIEIENVVLNKGEIKIGDFHMPYFKFVSIEEYKRLSKSEQKNCFPINHWFQLLGYYNSNKLENDYIKLNCKEPIKEFKYNSKTKTLKLNWDLIKNCN